MKINVIIVGNFKNEIYLRRAIKVFTNVKYVQEIILVVWQHEAESNVKLISDLEDLGVVIVVSKQPENIGSHAFYQMRALELGIAAIKNISLPIFKTRPDLYIKKKQFCKIIHLNRKISSNNKNLKQKIWVPWFEITKPYYIADECFFADYEDTKKLFNYEMIFDRTYEADAGISHIRRFIFLDDMNSSEVKNTLTRFLKSGHGTVMRARMLKYNLSCLEYNRCILHYLRFLKTSFIIGLENETDAYIFFRKWSAPNKKLTGDVSADFNIKKSFDKISGAIKAHNDNYISSYINYFETKISSRKDIDNSSLSSFSELEYLEKRKSMLKRTFLDIVYFNYLNVLRYLGRILS